MAYTWRRKTNLKILKYQSEFLVFIFFACSFKINFGSIPIMDFLIQSGAVWHINKRFRTIHEASLWHFTVMPSYSHGIYIHVKILESKNRSAKINKTSNSQQHTFQLVSYRAADRTSEKCWLLVPLQPLFPPLHQFDPSSQKQQQSWMSLQECWKGQFPGGKTIGEKNIF